MPLMHGQRVRLANLRLQLLQVQRTRDYLMAAFLLEEQRQHQQQRRRTIWVKPWLLRRVTLGHYDTFMQDLMCGARPVPEQEPHGRRTVYVGAPCGLFTSAVRYDPGISHGRRTASGDM